MMRHVVSHTVGDLMTPAPIVIGQDEPVTTAAALLEENAVSGLPVVDGWTLTGVISQTDLLRARATGDLWERWDELRVADLMASPVLTADRSMTLDEAARLMDQNHVHRLVVVDDEQQAPIGVLSISDFVRAIARGEA